MNSIFDVYVAGARQIFPAGNVAAKRRDATAVRGAATTVRAITFRSIVQSNECDGSGRIGGENEN